MRKRIDIRKNEKTSENQRQYKYYNAIYYFLAITNV